MERARSDELDFRIFRVGAAARNLRQCRLANLTAIHENARWSEVEWRIDPLRVALHLIGWVEAAARGENALAVPMSEVALSGLSMLLSPHPTRRPPPSLSSPRIPLRRTSARHSAIELSSVKSPARRR